MHVRLPMSGQECDKFPSPMRKSVRSTNPVKTIQGLVAYLSDGAVCPLTCPAGLPRVPHCRDSKLIRFERGDVMAWTKRGMRDAQDQGINVTEDPASQYRSS